MKISSGWSKGLKILAPAGLDTRPTRERVRQSALNMIQFSIQGANVLDLFAGSGSVGLELISRGATGAAFVENACSAIKCLEINVNQLKLRASNQEIVVDPLMIYRSDAFVFLAGWKGIKFDMIWADPPYNEVPRFLTESLNVLPAALKEGGIFILESDSSDSSIINTTWPAGSGLSLLKHRTYGVTLITIWQKSN